MSRDTAGILRIIQILKFLFIHVAPGPVLKSEELVYKIDFAYGRGGSGLTKGAAWDKITVFHSGEEDGDEPNARGPEPGNF